MGLFDFIKKQFIDVIEWTESENGVLSYRYPMLDREIQNGAQLTVRESQLALFVNEGEVADIFEPGRHVLSTKNLPILTSLKHWDKFFQSPFKSDLYFFSTRDQVDQRWGTTTPIVIQDQNWGPIRLRAHGTYSYKIENPKVFYKKVSGTKDRYSVSELEGQLRGLILTEFATFFGKTKIHFVDMAGSQTQFSENLKGILLAPFSEYGLSLESFFVQSLSLPEELQSKLDQDEDPVQLLGKLHELLTRGVITQAEFDSKKAGLLKRIR